MAPNVENHEHTIDISQFPLKDERAATENWYPPLQVGPRFNLYTLYVHPVVMVKTGITYSKHPQEKSAT